MECIGKNNTHTIFFILPDDSKEFNCPYILAYPHEYKENTPIILEANNQENTPRIVTSALENTMDYLFSVLYHSKNTNPILVPLLPSINNGNPYFQQLSIECFDASKTGKFHRIDQQVVSMIEDARKIISGLSGKQVPDKIFLNGYSSSGVFAQRFALLHPELVSASCIGGAIGTMPLPIDEYQGQQLSYPIGTADIEKLTGKEFDLEAYKKIKFTYYVTEGENEVLSENRSREDGTKAPMCDISYMERSTPKNVGKTVRDLFGTDSFERIAKQLIVADSLGVQTEYIEPIKGLTHHTIGNAASEIIGKCITSANDTSDSKTIKR